MKKMLIFLLLLIPTTVKALDVDIASNAESAILLEATTGEIIYQKNIHTRLAPASMTKMMSMLIIIEKINDGSLNWDEEVTASANASSMGGSQIFLETGEKMTVRDMLKGISIASGNDATVALAERIAVNEEGFVNLMNKRATELGLENTQFKNATGLDEANHYSSAYDMAQIARELVKYKEILEFTGTYETYLREGTDKKFWLVNTNKLVRFYQGVDGLKTGYTESAGYCLTATAFKNSMRLIGVVMKEPDPTARSSEMSSMFDYGFNNYMVEQMLSVTSEVGKIKVEKGVKEYVSIVPKQDVNILNNNSNNKRNVTYSLNVDTVSAPVKAGQVVGTLDVIEDDRVIMTIDITVLEDVKKANIFQLYYRYLTDVLSANLNI
ncbi:MAG: D-alanyl-D-alanine carboxypeptidase family protein [bacterium]|nr:D-alanyl-D-alanine carboxypeptidase family protein [bacterium]